MKKAIKILTIIGGVVGIIWSIVQFFTLLFGGAIVAATKDTIGSGGGRQVMESAKSGMLASIGSIIAVIVGLIFGILASGKKIGRMPTIIHGFLLLVAGVLATIWHSYVAGPMYILGALLAILAGAMMKKIEVTK